MLLRSTPPRRLPALFLPGLFALTAPSGLSARPRRLLARLLVGLAVLTTPAGLCAQMASEAHDLFAPTRQQIQRGTQALILCNGLFGSGRSVEQLYAQELSFRALPKLDPQTQLSVDHARRLVTLGGGPGDALAPMRAVFRDGLGAIILAPGAGEVPLDAQLAALPVLELPPLAGDPATIAWPDGDLLPTDAHPTALDARALDAALAKAFDPARHPAPERLTTGVLVVHAGRLVAERYAAGFDAWTRTRIFSISKSLNVTLLGMLVDDGKLELDAPLGFDWLPEAGDAEHDPRRAISLRHLLHMSSGLASVDNTTAYITGSRRSYWAGASSVEGALSRGLVRTPGTHWDYENFDTLLAVYAMKRALGGGDAYLEFPRRALLDKLGMRNTFLGTDRFGDYMLSSQVHTTARDLARLGLLYLQGGTWNGERLVSQEWIDFCWAPAPSTAQRGGFYGGQWWLAEIEIAGETHAMFSAQGNRGNSLVLVPSLELIVVRRGMDRALPNDERFDHTAFTREIALALHERD